jgi:hypothetical protein
MKLKDLKGKYAFISHPFANDPEGNRKKVDKICKYWVKKGVIPISPLHLFSFYEDDNAREDIMNICYKLIDLSDVVFIYGDSKGCRLEREYAEKIGKEVLIFYQEKRVPTFKECYYLMQEKGLSL